MSLGQQKALKNGVLSIKRVVISKSDGNQLRYRKGEKTNMAASTTNNLAVAPRANRGAQEANNLTWRRPMNLCRDPYTMR